MRIPFARLDVPLTGVTAGDLVPLPDEQRHHLGTVLRRADDDDEHTTPDEIAVVAVPGATTSLGRVVGGGVGPSRIRLLVGPEGGLTGDEIAGLVERGWTAARAADTVLRSVHAATVLVAATMAQTGRFTSD